MPMNILGNWFIRYVAHLRSMVLSRQWAWPRVMDGRPHLFLPSYYTGTKLYCVVTEAHRCN